MKYTNLTLLVLSGLLLQSCGKKGDVDTKSYNTIEIQRGFLFDDLPELQFEMLDTIDLEAPGNPPLKGTMDIAFSKDFFLLLDNRQGFLKFDYGGNFIQRIGAMGEGPGEYLTPNAIYLEEKENIVLVADWMKRVIISYDLDGNFNSSSQRLPGYPISLYKENDTLLVIQETLNGTKEKPRQVSVSSIEPITLEVKHWERPLYGYHSNYTIIHPIPRILSRVNEASLFYLPIIWEHATEHRSKDTIFRKVEDHLVPEYLLHFTGFDNADQLGISHGVMSDDYAFLYVVHKHRGHLVVVDLVNNRPIAHSRTLFDRELTLESIPRPLNGDVFYSILTNEGGSEEKNLLIVLYRIITTAHIGSATKNWTKN